MTRSVQPRLAANCSTAARSALETIAPTTTVLGSRVRPVDLLLFKCLIASEPRGRRGRYSATSVRF